MPLHLVLIHNTIWHISMTLDKATLPTPQFDQITLDQLKSDIQKAIENGQAFIAELQQVPESIQQQLQVLEQIDNLENQMSESWGCYHT